MCTVRRTKKRELVEFFSSNNRMEEILLCSSVQVFKTEVHMPASKELITKKKKIQHRA
jgi:hypothetical protein